MHYDTMNLYCDDENEYESNDTIDVGAPYGRSSSKKLPLPFTEKFINIFFTTLMNNLVFNLQFKVASTCNNMNKYCWCPCGKKMNQIYSLMDEEDFCTSNKALCCQGFMDHLENKGNRVQYIVVFMHA